MPDVVSLCDRTGNMVRPWARAGHECVAVDVENEDSTLQVGDGAIHYRNADVREFDAPDDARMAFAFPPCTDLAISGARWFQEKGLRRLADAIDVVGACHEILTELGCPWMLENPMSTLSTHWREPDHKFDPYQFDGYTDSDEAYTKETWLWTGGGFRMPAPRTTVERDDADDRIHKMPPSEDRSDRRAETPTGFAEAVHAVHELDAPAQSNSTEQARLPATDGGR